VVELSLFRPEEIQRYGFAAELIRETTRGSVYQNAVARLVHGPEGLVCELEKPWPALFAWLGHFVAEIKEPKAALQALWEAHQAVEEAGTLLVVYDDQNFYWKRSGEPTQGTARLRAPACLVLEAPKVRRLLFFDGREFLDFIAPPGHPVLIPLRE